MRSLIRGGSTAAQPQTMAPRTDPAPSKLAYRMERILLTPLYRRLMKYGIPLCLIAGSVWFVVGNEARRGMIHAALVDLRQQITNRPEFMVKALEIDGASPQLDAVIRGRFPYDFPVSSFDLELDALRLAIGTIPAVRDASVRVQTGGVLAVEVQERVPVVLWRTGDGLNVVDGEGVSIAKIQDRLEAPDLPLLAGTGATDQVSEALELIAAAGPLADRIRGLVRMGERRWDLVLDREQRIMLPEAEPVQALERVIALHQAQDLLARDVAAVDMRLGDRPTVRMQPGAVEGWRETAELINAVVSR